jgi:TonB family protein
MVQPLPSNQTNEEAVISVRFEVHPDGSLGRIIPLRKMNPELEREVMRTLRSWRFSRLPSGVPQEPQWGIITFRFVLD